MNGVFAYHVGVPLVFRMDGNASITQHCFNTSSSDDDFFIWTLDFVGERHQDAKFDLVFVARDRKLSTTRQFNFIHFNVGDGRFKSAGPVD